MAIYSIPWELMEEVLDKMRRCEVLDKDDYVCPICGEECFDRHPDDDPCIDLLN